MTEAFRRARRSAGLSRPELLSNWDRPVDTVAGTICWPNGVDIDPDVLLGDHEPATGHGPVLLKEYHLRPTG